MIEGLTQFLRNKQDELIKKIRTNVIREEVGYSEYTRWMETVSFDEEDAVDFEALMQAIEEFENSFKENVEDWVVRK